MKKEEMLSQEEIDALMQVFSQKTLREGVSAQAGLSPQITIASHAEDEVLSETELTWEGVSQASHANESAFRSSASPRRDSASLSSSWSEEIEHGDGFPSGESGCHKPASGVGELTTAFIRIDKNFQKQKEQFERISELFNYSLASSLSELLKRDVVLNNSVVENPVAYEDFLASMNNPSCVGVITFQETRMTVLLELDLNLAYSIIDIILGGKGDSYLKAKRALTDLELKLMKKPIEQILFNMDKVLHLKSQLEEVITYPYQISTNSSYEMVVPFTFNIVVEESKLGSATALFSTREDKTASSKFIHRITFCIPQIAMGSLFINQNTMQTDGKRENKYFLEAIKKSPFIDMPLCLQAQFPETEITIERLMEMKIGDTIVLDANKDDDIIEVELSVEGCPKFKGKLGAIGRYKAVEIISSNGFWR